MLKIVPFKPPIQIALYDLAYLGGNTTGAPEIFTVTVYFTWVIIAGSGANRTYTWKKMDNTTGNGGIDSVTFKITA